jgi:hypothetical protein
MSWREGERAQSTRHNAPVMIRMRRIVASSRAREHDSEHTAPLQRNTHKPSDAVVQRRGSGGEDVQIFRRESLTADFKPGHQLAPTAATVPPPHGQDMHDSELRMGARDRARAKNQARTACTALPTRAAR